MARIRTIKPEICTSAQFVECSTNARLLFVLMWMFCDDSGVHAANPKTLRMECFPGDDDINSDEVLHMVDELKVHGLVGEYVNGGSRYWYVTGWKHQRIDKPQPAKHPGPFDDGSEMITGAGQEHSKNVPGMHTRSVPGTFPPEGKGKERKGEEGKGSFSLRSKDARSRAVSAGENEKPKTPKPTLPDWLPFDRWKAYCEFRMRRKAPLTARAAELAIAELDKLRGEGHDPGKVLDQSVYRGWAGLFPLRADTEQHRGNGAKPPNPAHDENKPRKDFPIEGRT